MSGPRDILDEFERDRARPRWPEVPVRVGMVVEDRTSGFTGDVVKISPVGDLWVAVRPG